MRIGVSSCVVALIQRAAAGCAPDEACGLLFGSAARIDRAKLVANVAPDPRRHFEIDPAELLAALRAERAGGPAVVGYWHSHPSGENTPSVIDAEMAAGDGMLWLIVASGSLALWRATEGGAVHGRFEPVELVVD